MKRDYQEVIDAMSNGEYTAEEIKSRIRSYLNNPASKIEGSFAMDSIQAVAQEMARAINMRIIDFIDMAMLDTAVYEFLDRKGLDYGLARNPATASNGYVKFTGAQGTIIPKGITLLSDTCTFTTDFEAIISSSGTTSVRATCKNLLKVELKKKRMILTVKGSMKRYKCRLHQAMPILIYIGRSRFQVSAMLDVYHCGMELGLLRS